MMSLRPAIQELVLLGPFPSSRQCEQRVIDARAVLLGRIEPPVTDEEARALITLFGPDDYFGGAWTLVHLIESAPG